MSINDPEQARKDAAQTKYENDLMRLDRELEDATHAFRVAQRRREAFVANRDVHIAYNMAVRAGEPPTLLERLQATPSKTVLLRADDIL